MRHLPKSYPYQKPSKNRSSKNLNLILGPASVYPAYLAWSNEDLKYMASKCKNPINCYQDVLNARAKNRSAKAARRAAVAARKAAGIPAVPANPETTEK